jgi:hypothetical protein
MFTRFPLAADSADAFMPDSSGNRSSASRSRARPTRPLRCELRSNVGVEDHDEADHCRQRDAMADREPK